MSYGKTNTIKFLKKKERKKSCHLQKQFYIFLFNSDAFCCLFSLGLPSAMLNRSGESWQACVVPDLREKVLNRNTL